MKLLLTLLMTLSLSVNAEINVKELGAGDSLGNTPYENSQIFKQAVELAKETNDRVIYIPTGSYTLHDTWVIPSVIKIKGDFGRLASKIQMSSKNKPVIANEAWYNVTDPRGNVIIENLWIKGSKYAGSNNHCIVLTDFFSEVSNMYLSECGGYAMYFSSQRSDGSFHTNSSLVENKFTDSRIFNSVSGFRNGSKSDTYTPKLTDGRVQNININLGGNSGEVFELYEAAGWHVDSIHSYAHSKSWKFDRSGMMNVSNIYLENKGENNTFFKLTKTEHTANFINVMVGTVLKNNDIVFDLAGVSWVSNSVINVSNLNYVKKDEYTPLLFKRRTGNIIINSPLYQE